MQKTNGKIKILVLTALAFLFIITGMICVMHFTDSLFYHSKRAEFLHTLSQSEGKYNENMLVFDGNTETAKEVASVVGGKLRVSVDGKFATVKLDGKTVLEFANDSRFLRYLPYVSLDYNVELSAFILDQYYSKQTHFNYINLSDTWNATKGKNTSGEKVTVAIIDTGIDTDHPDFYNTRATVSNISVLSYNASDGVSVKDGGASVIEDTHGHGTAVAGVIASQINYKGVVGVAPEVDLMVIKCNVNEKGQFVSVSDIVYAIRYAIENGADVINMSFGGPGETTAQTQALNDAAAKNIVSVASTGNEGVSTLNYPASLSSTIGVGALAQDSWEIADYSNYGKNVDIVAPGTVLTALVGGSYGYMQGTSFSAPIVSAACALYVAKNGTTDFSTVKEHIMISAKDLGKGGVDEYFGYGALDVDAFVVDTKKSITYHYNCDKIEDTTHTYVVGNTMKTAPSYPENGEYAVENWYFDEDFTQLLEYENMFTHKFSSESALYAKWARIEDLFKADNESAFEYEDLGDRSVKITAYNGSMRYLIIPSSLGGKTVTAIGVNAFSKCNRLKRVRLPSTLSTVESKAFASLAQPFISIPSSVVSISSDAFYDCENLTAVYVSSPSVMRSYVSSPTNGSLFYKALSVAVDASIADLPSAFTQNYVYTEQMEYNGKSYVLYSKHEHVWAQVHTEQERVACKTDGIYLYKCECGIYKHVTKQKHNESEIKTNSPTCTSEGAIYTECLDCGEILSSSVLEKTEHSLVYYTGKASTCTESGYQDYEKCTDCKYSTYYELPALGHYPSDWVYDSYPDCENEGHRHIDCMQCLTVLEEENIDALGHELTKYGAKEPTCEEFGWNSYEACSRCEYSTYEELLAYGHTEIVDEAVTPTCTATGLSEGKHCEVCKKVITVQQELPILPHTESEWITDVIATCTQEGARHTECTECGERMQSEVLTVLPHTESEWITDVIATCTQEGARHTECTECGERMQSEVLTVLPHTESEWITDVIATCTQEGARHTECTECGERMQSEVLAELGHNYVFSTTVKPDFDNKLDGYDLYVCTHNEEHTCKDNTVSYLTVGIKVKIVGGTVNGESEITVSKGSKVTVSAQVPEGMIFDEWVIDGLVISTDEMFEYMATDNVVIEAKLREDVFAGCGSNASAVVSVICSFALMVFAFRKMFNK